jgi:fucose permease
VHIREARLRWTVLVLGIGVEFAMLFWGSTSLQAFTGATASSGAVGVGLFAGGMVAGRLLGPNLLSKADDVRVLRWSFIVATGGLVLIRVGPGLGVRLGAFAVVGLGLSLVYPLAFSRLYGSGLPDASVGAVGALASGAAITLSPPALGGLADVLDLRRAVLIVPLMALGALVLTVPRAEQPAS